MLVEGLVSFGGNFQNSPPIKSKSLSTILHEENRYSGKSAIQIHNGTKTFRISYLNISRPLKIHTKTFAHIQKFQARKSKHNMENSQRIIWNQMDIQKGLNLSMQWTICYSIFKSFEILFDRIVSSHSSIIYILYPWKTLNT